MTNSCVEEHNAATNEFEDAIVIEASITNEFKFQKILLSRTHKLEENNSNTETGATVRVTSNSNDTYTFHETDPGVYESDLQFSALPNIRYQLFVSASNGREYTSQNTELTSSSSVIENVYAIKETSEDGVDGVGVYLDSFDPENSSKYYGYEFEETYQIIAPNWIPNTIIRNPADTIIINNVHLHPAFLTIPKTIEDGECYKTVNSFGKLVTTTDLLSEDRISKFKITFFSKIDFRISSRYSILIKQYTQSAEAFNFHKTLSNFSSSESLLSQNQPGFLNGNITSTSNPNEKVIGYFEVSSMTQKRIFLNRSDFFDPFPWKCEIATLSDLGFSPSIIKALRLKYAIYFSGIENNTQPTLFTYPRACGDCTVLGSNIKPNFWID